MRWPGKVGKVAAVVGVGAYIAGSILLVSVLELFGVSSRAATGYSMMVLAFIGTAGLIASALGVLAADLRLPTWTAPAFLYVIPAVANGLFFGLLAELIAWSRVRARVLFWVIVLGLGSLWVYAVVAFIIIGTN